MEKTTEKTTHTLCEKCGKPTGKTRGATHGHQWCFNCYRKMWRKGQLTIEGSPKTTTKTPQPKTTTTTIKTPQPKTEKTLINQEQFQTEFTEYKNNLNPEMKELIPQDNGFIDEEGIIPQLMNAYQYNWTTEGNEKTNFLFKGETGTGKTQCAVSFAHAMNIPAYHITFNGATTPEQLFGYQKLIINKEGVQEQVWQDGIITKLARYGGVLILDEVNACPDEIAFVLFPLLDKLRRLNLLEQNGEVVKAHKGFFPIGTMNEGYAGTNELSPALVSRFNNPRTFDYSSKVEKKLVKQGKILSDEIVTFAEMQRRRWKKGDGEFTKAISTRDLILFKVNYELFGEKVALTTLCELFSNEEEKKAIKELYELEVKGKEGGSEK